MKKYILVILVLCLVVVCGAGRRDYKYSPTVTTTYDPGNLADGAGETSSGITVSGAVFGDVVLVSAPYDLQDLIVTAYVQAANTVEIRVQNESGGAVNLGSGTWTIRILR